MVVFVVTKAGILLVPFDVRPMAGVSLIQSNVRYPPVVGLLKLIAVVLLPPNTL
ncbi:hypothetical protein D3C85_1756370 [compost metagenome]